MKYVRMATFVVVAGYVFFPEQIDSRFGAIAGLAALVWIVLSFVQLPGSFRRVLNKPGHDDPAKNKSSGDEDAKSETAD